MVFGTPTGAIFRAREADAVARRVLGDIYHWTTRFYAYGNPPLSPELDTALLAHLDRVWDEFPELWREKGNYAERPISEHAAAHPLASVRIPAWVLLNCDAGRYDLDKIEELFQQHGLEGLRNFRNQQKPLGPTRTAADYPDVPSFKLCVEAIRVIKSNLIPGDVDNRRRKVDNARSELANWTYSTGGYRSEITWDYDNIQIVGEDNRITFYWFERVNDLPVIRSAVYSGHGNTSGDFSIRVPALSWMQVIGSYHKSEWLNFYIADHWLGIEGGAPYSWTNIRLLEGDLREKDAELHMDSRYNVLSEIEVDSKLKTWLGKAAKKSVKAWEGGSVRTWGFTQRLKEGMAVMATDGHRIHLEYGDYPEGHFLRLPKSAAFLGNPPSVNVYLDSDSYILHQFCVDGAAVVKALKRLKAMSGDFVWITWKGFEDGGLVLSPYSTLHGDLEVFVRATTNHWQDRIRRIKLLVSLPYLMDALSGFSGPVAITETNTAVRIQQDRRMAVIIKADPEKQS